MSNKGFIVMGENCKFVMSMKFVNFGWCIEEGFIGFFEGFGLKWLKFLFIIVCLGMIDVFLEVVGKVC